MGTATPPAPAGSGIVRGGGAQGERWAGRSRGPRPFGDFALCSRPKALQIGPIQQPNRLPIPGLKQKDLVGIPWRVAFALQDAGWYLRSSIVWYKKNPLPESIVDRPTCAYEMLFLLAKSGAPTCWKHRDTGEWTRTKPAADFRWISRKNRQEVDAAPADATGWYRLNLWRGFDYFYDADPIREPHTYGQGGDHHRNVDCDQWFPPGQGAPHTGLRRKNPKILAGWAVGEKNHRAKTGRFNGQGPNARGRRQASEPGEPCAFHPLGKNARNVWEINSTPFPGAHFATYPKELVRRCLLAGSLPGDVVLDPFGGSGTTGEVALKLGRTPVHLDISYFDIARKRLSVTPSMGGLLQRNGGRR